MFKKAKEYLVDYYSEENKLERQITGYMKLYRLTREDAIKRLEKDNNDAVKFGFKKNKGYLAKRESGILCCPTCLSENISTNQKEFGAGKAALGAATFGALGIAAGGIGSKKINCSCLDCGKKFDPKFK